MLKIRWGRSVIPAALLACGWHLGWAAPAALPLGTNGLTLDEAVRMALVHNPELRASNARVDAASGRAHQARKWSNPELELSAEDWPVSGGRGFSDAKQALGIAQTLPYPGKKTLDKQIGAKGIKLSDAQLAVRRTEIVRDVKAGFYRVLAAERLVAVSTQLVGVAESLADTARRRVDAGAAAYQEQLRAEVQWEQARAEWTGFQRELATARLVFATILGRPDLKDASLSGALAELPPPALTEDRMDGVLARHPCTAAARAGLEQAELEYRRARLEPYPDVQVSVSGGRSGVADESFIQLGLSLPLPILDRGRGRQQEAQANVNLAEADLETVLLRLHREWANAKQRYRSAVEQVVRYRERILPKADEALRLVQTGFEQGKFSFIDLLDTQRTTTEVRRAYQEKLLEMNLAQAELEAILDPAATSPSTTH
jgi:cobalt-zinc-cadmium efflux system outer membrane protein